jgi:hypothetical protein
MGKRASGAASTPVSGKKTKKLEDDKMAIEASEALTKSPSIVKEILKSFDELFMSPTAQYTSVDAFLTATFKTPDLLTDFVTKFEAQFPPEVGVKYSKDIVPGPKFYRFWQLGWQPECGNAGCVHTEDMKTLVTLMLCNGVKTNGDEMAGVEKLVLCPLQKHWFVDFDTKYITCKIPSYAVPAAGIGQVKGWKRSCAAWFITQRIIELDLSAAVKEALPELYDSLLTAYSIVHTSDTDEGQIFSSREACATLDCTRNLWSELHGTVGHSYIGLHWESAE